MIVVPAALFKLADTLFLSADLDGKFICELTRLVNISLLILVDTVMHVYPGLFVFVGLMRSAVVLYDLLSTWSQTIRDKEFLVEMRLVNHDNEKAEVRDNVGVEVQSVARIEAR